MTGQWRLATFNIESLDFKPSRAPEFEARLAVLRPLLHRLNADVLCLQEVNAQRVPNRKERRFTALETLVRGTQYAGYHCATSHDPATGGAADVHNLAILARWPIRNSRQIYHDVIPPLISPLSPKPLKWDRPVQLVEVGIPHGNALYVVNMHLRAPRAVPLRSDHAGPHSPPDSAEWAKGFFLAASKRQGQALETRLAIETLFNENPDALVAVCGDLNSDAYETPAKIICASAADMEDSAAGARDEDGLSDRSLTALDSRISEAARFSVIHDGRPVMLDHILASKALAHRCISVEIFNADLQDEFRAADIAATSFHAPVIATFSAADIR